MAIRSPEWLAVRYRCKVNCAERCTFDTTKWNGDAQKHSFRKFYRRCATLISGKVVRGSMRSQLFDQLGPRFAFLAIECPTLSLCLFPLVPVCGVYACLSCWSCWSCLFIYTAEWSLIEEMPQFACAIRCKERKKRGTNPSISLLSPSLSPTPLLTHVSSFPYSGLSNYDCEEVLRCWYQILDM